MILIFCIFLSITVKNLPDTQYTHRLQTSETDRYANIGRYTEYEEACATKCIQSRGKTSSL